MLAYYERIDRRMVQDPIKQREPVSAGFPLRSVGILELVGNINPSHSGVVIIDYTRNWQRYLRLADKWRSSFGGIRRGRRRLPAKTDEVRLSM